MQLELSDVEVEYLQRTLTDALGDLRAEISNTDTREFKDQLQHDEDLLRGILGRLGVALPSDA